jgi:tetratricopeptide (TPR) repeat protein
MVAAAAVLIAGSYTWNKLHSPSPYTTEVRLAVLPLDNMTGAENDMLVAGLSEHLSRVSRWVAQGHASMWTVPYISIINADLPSPKAARDAFGSNRVLTGNVQRFQSEYRVNLKLFDTRSGRVLKSAAIRFDTHRPDALNDTLLVATAEILGMRAANVAACPLRSSNALAIPVYLEGIARLREAGTTGPVDRAAALLDSCVTIDPNFAAGLCAAGNAELQQYRRHPDSSMLERALVHGRKSLGNSPKYAEADILVGESFQRMQMPDSVEHYLRAATVAEPTLLTAYQRLGNFYVAQKRVDEAEATYRKLIDTCPDFWAAHLRLGLFCFEQRRVEDAQASWETALTLAPHDPLTLNNLGAVHHRRGEWAKARVLFLQSFQARPDCESSDNVALTHYFEGHFEDAAKYFEFALQYCDTTTDVPWGDLARALYWTSTGRPRAVSLYNKALLLARASLQEHPDDVQLMTSIMEYEAMSDNAAGAREMIERVRPLLKDDGHAMYRVASVVEKLGERTAALDLIADAIRHEFPIAEIRGDPMLKELTEDPRFLEMVHNEMAAEGAQAAGKAP